MCLTKISVMSDLREEILDRVTEAIRYLYIDCPDCESMTDDDQYTCTTCWQEGGNGRLNVSDYVNVVE